MRQMWKLLRSHVSMAQLMGFFVAGLVGTTIVLLAIQLYDDVKPVLNASGKIMDADFMVVNKKMGTLGSIMGKHAAFSNEETEQLAAQPFAKKVGAFVSSHFRVTAGLKVEKYGVNMQTAMFFEAVPNEFVDVESDEWHYAEGDETIPIIIPKSYLNLYNFGFAQSQALPMLSEKIMNLVSLDVLIGNERFKGNIVGFSNKLNTILVPMEFIRWANARFAPSAGNEVSRLILQVNNPADERIVKYFQEHGYDSEGESLKTGRLSWFLRMAAGMVMAIGLVISLLAIYLLMLSVFLLVEKNSGKLRTLLLLGYSRTKVALPYQLLVLLLNLGVLFCACVLVYAIRCVYAPMLAEFAPSATLSSVPVAIWWGLGIWVVATTCNMLIIRNKLNHIS